MLDTTKTNLLVNSLKQLANKFTYLLNSVELQSSVIKNQAGVWNDIWLKVRVMDYSESGSPVDITTAEDLSEITGDLDDMIQIVDRLNDIYEKEKSNFSAIVSYTEMGLTSLPIPVVNLDYSGSPFPLSLTKDSSLQTGWKFIYTKPDADPVPVKPLCVSGYLQFNQMRSGHDYVLFDYGFYKFIAIHNGTPGFPAFAIAEYQGDGYYHITCYKSELIDMVGFNEGYNLDDISICSRSFGILQNDIEAEFMRMVNKATIQGLPIYEQVVRGYARTSGLTLLPYNPVGVILNNTSKSVNLAEDFKSKLDDLKVELNKLKNDIASRQ